MEKIEDALSALKVTDVEGNRIRLSLRTYVPNLDGLLSQQKIEDVSSTLEQNHELVLEVVDGTMQIKNVEVENHAGLTKSISRNKFTKVFIRHVKKMTSVGTSDPNSLQPSTQPFDGKAENGKMKVIVEPHEVKVKENVVADLDLEHAELHMGVESFCMHPLFDCLKVCGNWKVVDW